MTNPFASPSLSPASSDRLAKLNATYTPTPYSPDNGVSPSGLIVVLLILGGVGVALGFVAALVAQAFWLILVFPLIIGAAVGGAGMWAIKLGKLRNPLVASVLGLIAGLFAMTTMHYYEYSQFMSEPGLQEQLDLFAAAQRENPGDVASIAPEIRHLAKFAVSDRGFVAFLDMQADFGVSISKATSEKDKGFNLGRTGTLIYWLVEVLLVGGVAFTMMRGSARRPFCRVANEWKKPTVLGRLAGSPASVATVFSSGNMMRLAEMSRNGGDITVTAFISPASGPNTTVDVRVERENKDEKGNTSKVLIGEFTFPHEALEAMRTALLPTRNTKLMRKEG